MEVGGNVCFDYFMNVFKIHFGAICHSALTQPSLLLTFITRMGPFHVKWYAGANVQQMQSLKLAWHSCPPLHQKKFQECVDWHGSLHEGGKGESN